MLTIPERALFTGTAIVVHRQARLAAACTLSRNRSAYAQRQRKKKIGGLVLEVKGDFCTRFRNPDRHGRAEDYIEIGLGPSTATIHFTTT